MMEEGPTILKELDRYVFPWGKDGARRRILSVVSPREFGAVGDGVADDSGPLKAAIQEGVATGQTVYLDQDYLVTETIQTAGARIWNNGGAIVCGFDGIALRFGQNTDWITDEQSVDVRVDGGVAHTSVLVQVQARLHVVGTFVARGSGSHGIYFDMGVGDNLNWTRGSFRATQCAGDGIRVENTTGASGNLNAWQVELRGDSCGVGVRVLDGIGGYYIVRTDNCTNEGAIFGGGGEGVYSAFVFLYDDSSNGAISIFTGQAGRNEGGQLLGTFNSGIPLTDNDANWLTIFQNQFTAQNADGADLAVFGNTLANDSSEWGDLIFRVNSAIGAAGVIGRLRIRGDNQILLQDMANLQINPTNLGFYGKAPVAQQTGVAVSAAAIHAALVNLGLITA